jgi:two-component system sensor histidine kinase RpfC
MNFPFLKHPKSAQELHPTNNHYIKQLIEKVRESDAERSQEEFLSIASHELRTPLTAIKGNTSLIKQYFWDQIPGGELRGMLDDIDQASDRMLKLVNNFLDTMRLEQGLAKFEPIKLDLQKVAQAVVSEFMQRNNFNKEVQIVVNEPKALLSQVYADTNWTQSLVGYILDNAVKYTERGVVTISFAQDPDYIRMLISDTGQGIAPEAQKKLFKKFAQTNENVLTRDTVQGTGLGLYLAKMVSEHMHGDVKLDFSEVGKGSTFSIILPKAK